MYFICADAITIYHDLVARGVSAGRPFVRNGNGVTALKDPDGELPRLKPRLGCLSLKRRSFYYRRLGDSRFAERRVYPS